MAAEVLLEVSPGPQRLIKGPSSSFFKIIAALLTPELLGAYGQAGNRKATGSAWVELKLLSLLPTFIVCVPLCVCAHTHACVHVYACSYVSVYM